jgi:hypothetical protein
MLKTITNTQTVERINSHTDRRNRPGSFDRVGFTVVPLRRFEELRVGEVFRAPSHTLTDAHVKICEHQTGERSEKIDVKSVWRDFNDR